MKSHVEIGEAHNLELRHALLVYANGHRAFASLHDVIKRTEGAPLLGPARSLSLAFVRELSRSLGSQASPEILPANVLARTPEIIAWWSPASRRIMFFGGSDAEARKLNGRLFPHPSLIFKVCAGQLFVRALERNARPGARTLLKTAPYWNVAGDDGGVCMGTARGTGGRLGNLDCGLGELFSPERIYACPGCGAAYDTSRRLCGTMAESSGEEAISGAIPYRCR